MANVHVYFGIENLALTNPQRNTLFSQLTALGREDLSIHPNRKMQTRTRLDGQAAILEAVFDENDLTLSEIRSRLATIFGVAVGTISTVVSTVSLAGRDTTLVVFSRLGVDYIRMVAFGFNSNAWPSWELSREAASAYIRNNSVSWENGI